jgi:hypothetical protein
LRELLKLSSIDLPDYTKQISINVNLPESQNVSVRPKGGVLANGFLTTTSAYQKVTFRKITSGKKFQLSRIMINAEKAAVVYLSWNEARVGIEMILDNKSLAIIHYPFNYYEMIGDGNKEVAIFAKYYSQGSTVSVEICGEEY